MKLAHGFTSALAAEFPALDDPNAAKGASQLLLDLRRLGRLVASENALAAPDGIGDSIKTIMTRLNKFSENLHNETKDLSAEVRPGTLRARDTEVREEVRNLHSLADLLRPRVLVYEQRFADAVARSNAAL